MLVTLIVVQDEVLFAHVYVATTDASSFAHAMHPPLFGKQVWVVHAAQTFTLLSQMLLLVAWYVEVWTSWLNFFLLMIAINNLVAVINLVYLDLSGFLDLFIIGHGSALDFDFDFITQTLVECPFIATVIVFVWLGLVRILLAGNSAGMRLIVVGLLVVTFVVADGLRADLVITLVLIGRLLLDKLVNHAELFVLAGDPPFDYFVLKLLVVHVRRLDICAVLDTY